MPSGLPKCGVGRTLLEAVGWSLGLAQLWPSHKACGVLVPEVLPCETSAPLELGVRVCTRAVCVCVWGGVCVLGEEQSVSRQGSTMPTETRMQPLMGVPVPPIAGPRQGPRLPL